MAKLASFLIYSTKPYYTQANWSPYNVTYLFYGGFSRCTCRASLLIGGF